ncbi:unnamed protein product, partial [Vitis vinifera]
MKFFLYFYKFWLILDLSIFFFPKYPLIYLRYIQFSLEIDLHEGDWGTVGSVIEWSYVIDGKNHVAKEIVEAIDKENKAVTFKVIEGDLLKEYKSFKAIVQTISKGETTWVRWTFEYEKLNKEISTPVKLLGFVIHMNEELDDHLIQA